MGVVSSMSTAISGLEANGEALGVISDNIANANTTGFKSSRSEFQSILAQDLLSTGAGAQLGKGVSLGGITNVFTQGPITHTERGTDLAISGNGFFAVRSEGKGMTYTRDGSFRFDKDGWMTNLSGSRCQAYQATPDGKVTGKLGDVRVPFNTVAAKPSNKMELHVNLDARLPNSLGLDLTKPEETAQFTTGAQIYDSVGNAHAVSFYFNKTADSTWEWHAMTDGGNLANGTQGVQSEIAQGNLSFDPEGKLLTSNQTLVNTSFTNGAIPDQNLQFDFGDPLDQLGTGQKGSTQYGSKNVTFRNIQDGWAAGALIDTTIDSEGIITGVYNNGVNKVLGQIAMARFESTERLSKIGENQFRETVDSGQPLIGKAGTNGRGSILVKSLEQSNVDLAKEFVDMIKIQRGFQANAKSITSANEMLEEVINLRRA